MHRPTVGVLAVILLLAGGVLLVIDVEDKDFEPLGGACLRVGIMLSLVWLAEPQLRSMPAWLPLAIVILAVVLAVRPKLFPIGLAAVAAMWLLRPRRS